MAPLLDDKRKPGLCVQGNTIITSSKLELMRETLGSWTPQLKAAQEAFQAF